MAQSKQNALWETTYNWFRLQNFAVNKSYCKAEISTHADYPALTSIIDFCNMGGAGNFNAVEANASHIHEMNYPVLAHIKQPGNEYMHIIPTAADWDAKKDITQHWSGVAIFPEKNAKWQHIDNDTANREKNTRIAIYSLLAALAIGLFSYTALLVNDISINVFAAFSLLGLLFSLFALGSELGYQNDMVKQVCGAVSNGGCDKVLKSKNAKGLFGFTPAHLSVAYFASLSILFLLTASNNSLFYTSAAISISGIVLIAWSFYSQAVVVKEWCAICLGIVAALAAQLVITAVFIITTTSITSFAEALTLNGFTQFACIFAALALGIYPIKQFIARHTRLQQQSTELKKWKTDASVFVSQWKNEAAVNNDTWENDLVIGNPDAPLQITVACNPYCGPCAKAHEKLDELVTIYTDALSVKIRLLFRQDIAGDTLTTAATQVFKLAGSDISHREKQAMLTDWFAMMNLEKWMVKWNTKIDSTKNVDETLNQHSNWINASDIMFTPTFFING